MIDLIVLKVVEGLNNVFLDIAMRGAILILTGLTMLMLMATVLVSLDWSNLGDWDEGNDFIFVCSHDVSGLRESKEEKGKA